MLTCHKCGAEFRFASEYEKHYFTHIQKSASNCEKGMQK